MKNHYPAIDVLASISRLMSELVDDEHKELAGKIRRILSVYRENQDLISIGAYKAGTNAELDRVLGCMDKIDAFLRQRVDESYSYEEDLEQMRLAVE